MLQIDVPIAIAFGRGHPFRLQQLFLYLRAAEREGRREPPRTIDHTVTRHFSGIRIDVQRIPDGAGSARIAAQPRDLPVCCDAPARDHFDDLVNGLEKIIFHASTPSDRRTASSAYRSGTAAMPAGTCSFLRFSQTERMPAPAAP